MRCRMRLHGVRSSRDSDGGDVADALRRATARAIVRMAHAGIAATCERPSCYTRTTHPDAVPMPASGSPSNDARPPVSSRAWCLAALLALAAAAAGAASPHARSHHGDRHDHLRLSRWRRAVLVRRAQRPRARLLGRAVRRASRRRSRSALEPAVLSRSSGRRSTRETRIERDVAARKIDAECGTTTITLSRMERVDFSVPIFVDGAQRARARRRDASAQLARSRRQAHRRHRRHDHRARRSRTALDVAGVDGHARAR